MDLPFWRESPVAFPSSPSTWLPFPGSVPMGSTSVGETCFISIKSCIKSDTSSIRSRDSPFSFRNIPLPTSSPSVLQHTGPRVVFNLYVKQSIIIDGKENDSGSETDVVSELGLDNDKMLLKRMSRTFDSPSFNKDLGEDTDEEPTPSAPKLIRCAIRKAVNFLLIQALPPVQLVPNVEDAERGVTVIFVPPKAHAALKEEDVLPVKTKPPPPPTSKLQRTLSSYDLTTFIKNEMVEMELGEMGGARSRSAPSVRGARAHRGWLLLDGSDSRGEEGLFLSTVMTRRRLREKRTKEVKAKPRFSFGNEDVEGDDEGEGSLNDGWEMVSGPEEQCGTDGGRVTDSQIQMCVQGNAYSVHDTVETSSEAVVYHEEESREGVPSTIGTTRQAIDEEATQANERGVRGVVDADVEEAVNGVVELGDAGVWVEEGHGEEGGEGQASQAAAAGPLAMIVSWVKPAVGLRFWKK